MTPQETDLITTLLERLKGAAGQQKDPEADALIRQAVAERPDMPYYLVQTVLIQDLSLHNAQNRIAELERQVSDAQQKPTSFLGGLFGHSAPPAVPTSTSSPGPWTRTPQPSSPPPQAAPPPYAQGYAQPGYAPPPYGAAGAAGGFMGGGTGGGFLRSAAATAAGVAGGALLFEGISSLFGHHEAYGMYGGGMTPGLGETVINNYYGDSGGPQGGSDFASSDDDSGAGGFDPGGGQDFSSDQDFGGGSDFGGDSGGSDDFTNC
jgi:uncharacterized protein